MKILFIWMFSLLFTDMYPQSPSHVTPFIETSLLEKPYSQAKEILLIPKDTRLKLLEINGDYYKVEYKGTHGFILSGFCYAPSPVKSSSKYKKNSPSKSSYSYQCQAITKKRAAMFEKGPSRLKLLLAASTINSSRYFSTSCLN